MLKKVALPLYDRMNRSYEGSGKERNAGDVVGLRLCMDYQLNASSLLKGLGEVAFFAPGYDVLAECLKVAVGDDGDSEGGVLAAFLVMRLLAELLTVPNKVMVC